MKRFNHDADNQVELKNYVHNRAIQLLGSGATLNEYKATSYGAHITWNYQGKIYDSVFLYPSARGQGVYSKIVKDNNYQILTVPDCAIEDFLLAKKIPHLVLNRFLETYEYKIIEEYYGDQKAARSQVYLMNHIDEGLAILDWIGASEETKRAYCLHPFLQSDQDLAKNYKANMMLIDHSVVILAMEYRNIANAYLSSRKITSLEDIQLSPLKEVQDMLIADKIQNYKDFLLYHKDSHPRSKELDEYFNNWLKKLDIEDKFYEYSKKLIIPSF